MADPDATRLFEATLAAGAGLGAKAVANWVTGEYLETPERRVTARSSSTRRSSAAIIRAVADGSDLAGEWPGGARGARRRPARPPPRSSPARGSRQISDAGALDALIDAVFAANPAAVADYRAGKPQAVGFLVGQVMKASRGQANAALVQSAVRARLDGSTRRLTVGLVNLLAVGRRDRPDRRRVPAGPRAVAPLPGPQGRRTRTSPATRRGAAASRDDGKTGASVAMELLRRQAQIGGAIAIAGVVLVVPRLLSSAGRSASAAASP